MTVWGQIADEQGDAVPSASVELWSGNLMLKRVSADGNGGFIIDGGSTAPDKLVVTSAEFERGQWPLPESEDLGEFRLRRKIPTGGEVIITATYDKKKVGILALGLLALLLLSKKK